MDSIHYETIRIISKDYFEILFPDSVKSKLGMNKNPLYNRVNRNIKPDKMIFGLYSKLIQLGIPLEVDTLRDSTIYYHCYLPGTRIESISALGNEIKLFFDEQMGSLPREEALNEYDQSLGKTFNECTWENISSKIIMECYFNFRDTTDRNRFNNIDQLEVKIWQNIK